MKSPKVSSSEQLQDSWTCGVLKHVELPAVEPRHTQSFLRDLQKFPRTPGWMMPSGLVAAGGTAALVGALLLFRPSLSVAAPTLSQVDQAELAAKSFTVVHRIGSGGSAIYVVTESRDGERWKVSYGSDKGALYGETFMDGHQTVSIRRLGKLTQVLIDDASKYPKRLRELPTPENFLATPSEIFQAHPGKVTVKRGVNWNGKVVDAFESDVPIHRLAWQGTFRHVLYADPISHQPLQLEVSLPGSTQGLGETFTYDYAPIPESAFTASFPKGAKVTDVREEREAVRAALTKDGLVIVDDWYTAGVFMPDRPSILRAAKANKVRVHIAGGPASYTWPQPVMFSANGRANTKTLWPQPVIYVQPPVANLGSLRKATSVRVLVNGKPFTMPVKRIADAQLEFEFTGRRM